MKSSILSMMKRLRITPSGQGSRANKNCYLLLFITIQTHSTTYSTKSEPSPCPSWWFMAAMTQSLHDLSAHRPWYTCVICINLPNNPALNSKKWKIGSRTYRKPARKRILIYKRSLFTTWMEVMQFMCQRKIIRSFRPLLMSTCMLFWVARLTNWLKLKKALNQL